MFDGEDKTRAGHRRAEARTRLERRRWSAADKARVVAEALAPGAVVSAVARRWQMHPQQVFAWRREAACADLALPSEVATAGSPVPAFVPILTEAIAAEPASASASATASAPVIEVELAGAVVRVAAGADTAQLAAVLCAIRTSASA